MSSGSYFPPPVKAVEIPKAHGRGTRMLGVPCIADRIAQTVVAARIEAAAEPVFCPGSFGYRPGRKALEAIRGQLTGAAEDPAMQGEPYPRIEWSSGISTMVRDGSTFRMTYAELFTVRTHPNVRFTPERLEVFGRLENGGSRRTCRGYSSRAHRRFGLPTPPLGSYAACR